MRANYRLVRLPLLMMDERVLPTFFEEGAPERLAFARVLIGCDRAAAFLLSDESAAAHADLIRQRSATVRYAIARRQRRTGIEAELVLEQHRARFRERQRH